MSDRTDPEEDFEDLREESSSSVGWDMPRPVERIVSRR
jgi:hypothetical protein